LCRFEVVVKSKMERCGELVQIIVILLIVGC
jgi:hypothetical protein